MDILQFFGRLHPLVLHLPIGILALGFLMECLAKKEKYKTLQPAIHLTLLFGMWSAVFAAVSGYLLSWEGGYEETTLNRHQYLGIATVVLTSLLYFFQKKKDSKIGQKFYLPVFAVLMLLIGLTGHLGGSLTHGADFLSEPFSQSKESDQVTIENIDSARVFHDLIQPIFKQKCTGCHNESKIKGELLMTSIEGIQKGGETGAFLIEGDVENSLFLQRVHLPIEEKEHMPPKGKKQLNKDEIALLEWWVEHGAPFDKKAGAIHQSEAIKTILDKYATTDKGVFALKVDPLSVRTLQKIERAGIPVEMVAQDQPFVKVSLRGRSDLDKKTFDLLQKAANQLIELDLSQTNMTDELLPKLANFPHLTKLSLQQTEITGKNLNVLNELSYLEYLNLYETSLEEEALQSIAQLPNLKNLYLWRTNISAQSIEALKEEHPHLYIDTGVDRSLFGTAQLNPPMIVVEKDIFTDTLEVAFEINFKEVDLFYTLDGTPPDSTSEKYTDPIMLTQTADIQVIAKKEGWQTSDPAQKSIVRARYQPKEIRLNQPPDDRYKASGASSLTNFKKGTTEFAAGEWLGYEKSHMTATLDMGQAVSVSNITVSALEATSSYIFFPKNIKVWVSADGSHYRSIAQKAIPTTNTPEPPSLQNFTLNFDQQEARYIKIEVKSNLVNPTWHPAPGAPCWLFIDEILVD